MLPRHKQEQLGRLVRRAMIAGDRQRAQRYLAWMIPNAPELDADSEFRVSSAVVATMDRDAQRVLVLLGPQKDAIPIVDSMDPLASVLPRERLRDAGQRPAGVGHPARAARPADARHGAVVLPGAAALPAVGRRPTRRRSTQQAAKRAAAGAGAIGCLVGVILGFTGLVLAVVGVATALATRDGFGDPGLVVLPAIGVVLLVVGVVVVLMARAKGKRAAWLRTNGLSLAARIVNAERTGTMINDVPVYRFILQVAGPNGPYPASFKKLTPEHEVAMAMGRDVRVRANPNKLDEVLLED